MDNLSDKTNSPIQTASQTSLHNSKIDAELISIKDSGLYYLHQKVKKIVAVLFRLSGIMQDEKVIAERLKESSLALISECADFERATLGSRDREENILKTNILKILSLLEVAAFSNLISPMNVAILRQELGELLTHISSLVSTREAPNLNFGSYLKNEKTELQSPNNTAVSDKRQEQYFQGHLKDNYPVASVLQKSGVVGHDAEKGHLKDFSSVAVKKNRRQSLVISLLKKKKEIMIKDLMGIITDCSEKTIQRELSALVESGLLKKTGERRWTKYSLAKLT